MTKLKEELQMACRRKREKKGREYQENKGHAISGHSNRTSPNMYGSGGRAAKIMADRKKVIKLTDTVYYQAGSVVSKEIVKSKTGSVTLFAFDRGQGLSEHTAPFDALVYIMDGEAEITISDKAFNPKAGDFIIMPANEPHSVKAANRFKMMLVMIK